MIQRLIVTLLILGAVITGCVSLAPRIETGIDGTGQPLADGIGGTGQKLVDGLGGTGQKLADGVGGTGQKVADGVGGTGQKVADGMGGTGQKVADGVGGTGQKLADGLGGTGIIGTITDFGSIWINTIHVHFDQAPTIRMNDKPASADDFKLGQVVAVLSDRFDQGFQARQIDIVHEVVGPITSIDLQKQQLIVLNQQVSWRQDTFIMTPHGPVKAQALQPHQWIQVSGLRQKEGVIIASRIDQIEPSEQVELIGKLDKGTISGQPVDIGANFQFDAQADRLLIKGKLIDGVIHADTISKDAMMEIIEQASDLLLEGFLFDDAFDGDIVVGGIDIVLPDDFEFDQWFDADAPVFIEAELGDDDLFYTEDFMAIPEGGEDYIDLYPDLDDFYDEDIELMTDQTLNP